MYLEDWINRYQFDELMKGILNAPQDLLGIHEYAGTQLITAYRPEAEKVWITDEKGGKKLELRQIDERGLFVTETKTKYKSYRFLVQYSEDDVIEIADPYSFSPEISVFDCHRYG